jgi:hypothetical protein
VGRRPGFAGYGLAALQYALSGGGEVRALTGARVHSLASRPIVAETDFNVWSQ